MSADIRLSSAELLSSWLVEGEGGEGGKGAGVGVGTVVGDEVVGCAGGWVKGLKTFCTVLGWDVIPPSASEDSGTKRGGRVDKKTNGGWTSGAGTAKVGARGGGSAVEAKMLSTFSLFLRRGLLPPPPHPATHSNANSNCSGGPSGGPPEWPFPFHNVEAHLLPTKPNPFSHLNLFGQPRDEEGEMYVDYEDRGLVFWRLGYGDAVRRGVEGLKRDEGEIGRGAGSVGKVLRLAEEMRRLR